MYSVHIVVASLVYIYVYVGSKTIFSPVKEIGMFFQVMSLSLYILSVQVIILIII